MLIDVVVHFEPQLQADITDFVGIAIVIATYFWAKNRRARNKETKEIQWNPSP